MTEGAHPLLARRVPRRIDEELAPALLGRRVSLRQVRSWPTLGERLQRLARKEAAVSSLERRDRLELGRRRRDSGLRVTGDRTRRLSLQVRVAHVVHQCRIEPGRVDRARNPAGKDDGGRGRIVHEDHTLRQVAFDQDRCVRGNPAGAAEEVVEAIVAEQRLGRVFRKALGHFRRVDGAVVPGMAGATRSAVAPERFVVEQPLPFRDFSGRDGQSRVAKPTGGPDRLPRGSRQRGTTAEDGDSPNGHDVAAGIWRVSMQPPGIQAGNVPGLRLEVACARQENGRRLAGPPESPAA